jgi:cyanophycinase-like exopeptidase
MHKLLLSFLFGFLISANFSCSGDKSKKVTDLETYELSGSGKLILYGESNPDDYFISQLIRSSGIENGGYVVIVPIDHTGRESLAEIAFQSLMKHRIMAIYVLAPVQQAMESRTEMVKVEGARAIIFVGRFLKELLDLPADNPFSVAVKKAYSNGSTLAFLGPNMALAGQKVLRKAPLLSGQFPDGSRENYQLNNGLSVVSEMILDATFANSVISEYGELKQLIEETNLSYIGLGKSSFVIIDDGKLTNKGTQQVVYLPQNQSNKNKSWKSILQDGYIKNKNFKADK